MKPSRSIAALVFAFAFAVFPAHEFAQQLAPPLKIEASLAEARARAAADGRLLYLEYMMNTCPHCQAFKKNVLSSPAFREFADKHLAVVIYDLADLASIPDEEQKVAKDIQARFHIENVPTILLFSSLGKQLLRLEGYSGGTPEAVIANLEPLLKKAAASSALPP
jgi:thioredoxin-related protein